MMMCRIMWISAFIWHRSLVEPFNFYYCCCYHYYYFLLKYDLDSRQSCPAHSLSVNVWMNPHVCANIAAISSFLSDKMRHQPVFMTFVHIATCTVIQQLSYSHFKKPFFFSFHCKWLFVDFNVYCCCIATMYLCKKI